MMHTIELHDRELAWIREGLVVIGEALRDQVEAEPFGSQSYHSAQEAYESFEAFSDRLEAHGGSAA